MNLSNKILTEKVHSNDHVEHQYIFIKLKTYVHIHLIVPYIILYYIQIFFSNAYKCNLRLIMQ